MGTGKPGVIWGDLENLGEKPTRKTWGDGLEVREGRKGREGREGWRGGGRQVETDSQTGLDTDRRRQVPAVCVIPSLIQTKSSLELLRLSQ